MCKDERIFVVPRNFSPITGVILPIQASKQWLIIDNLSLFLASGNKTVGGKPSTFGMGIFLGDPPGKLI